MDRVRINIIGASGSGTSTLARTVAAALAVPCFESDDYYHAPSDPPFQRPREPQARHDMITGDLTPHPSWVLAGGVGGWSPAPALDFTLVVLLWVPTQERVRRLRLRERERFGERLAPGGDMHANHEAFIDWASRYDTGDIEGKTLQRHEAYLGSLTCPVLGLRGERPLDTATSAVLAALDTARP